MYQESPPDVEDAEYHIMYDPIYEPMKLSQDAAATLKLTTVVPHSQPLSATDSLTTVSLSEGEALVTSALANNVHSSTNTLTTNSFTGGVRLTTPSLASAETLAITPLTTDTSASTLPITNTIRATAIPAGQFGTPSISNSDSISSGTISVVDSSTQRRPAQMTMNQSIATSEGVIEGNLVSSSSIDAIVTTMVASSDCPNVNGSCRKLQIVKLLGDDALSLDMVRIIAEQETDNTSSHGHSLSMITRSGTLVHAKLADNGIVDSVTPNQYRQTEVIRPAIRDSVGNKTCNVVWTCAYCSFAFSSSEALGQHQEKECTENPSNVVFATTTSQSTVDALMSPLRQAEEPTYQLKLEGDPQQNNTGKESQHGQKDQDEESSDLETTWTCAVCDKDFTDPKELSQHHLSHSVVELATTLFKLTTPRQKPKKKVRTVRPESPIFSKSVLESSLQENAKSRWKKDSSDLATKMEEEMVDNPGDTPPQTPPLEGVRRTKKKPGPKAKQKDKNEKRKYVRRLGDDGKPVRQREYKVSPAGQGSRDPHTCCICNKVLSSRGNLAKHLVLHNLDKPWVCDLCGMGFNAKRDHKHHYLQHHTSERPNICPVCGKGYVDSRYLYEHMVCHTQERLYTCEICGKSFRTVKCVARHKKRHEKEKNFTCAICCKSFAVKADLTSHIRKVHQNDKKSLANKQKSQQLQQQAQEQQQQMGQESQQVKSKDITEFLMPSEEPTHILSDQLLPADLNAAMTTKDGIFISSDPLAMPSIIPIPGTGDNTVNCSYGVALTTPAGVPGVPPSVGDHATYIMINNPEEAVATNGLNIMYATAPNPNATHQVREVDSATLEQINQLSSSVSSSLVSSDGQLHQHLDTHTHLHQQEQNTQTLISDEAVLEEEHRSELGLGNAAEVTTELRENGSHSGNAAATDPGPGFNLELLSQTIQLELQRTQTSTNFVP